MCQVTLRLLPEAGGGHGQQRKRLGDVCANVHASVKRQGDGPYGADGIQVLQNDVAGHKRMCTSQAQYIHCMGVQQGRQWMALGGGQFGCKIVMCVMVDVACSM